MNKKQKKSSSKHSVSDEQVKVTSPDAFANPVGLKNMFCCIHNEILRMNNISELEKLLLIGIVLSNGITYNSNSELGQVFGKNPVTISRAISNLVSKGLLITMGETSDRTIALNEYAESSLFNYSYSYFSSTSTYRDYQDYRDYQTYFGYLSFSVKQPALKAVAKAVNKEFKGYEPLDIARKIQSFDLKDWIKEIKRESLGQSLLKRLRVIEEDGGLRIADRYSNKSIYIYVLQVLKSIFSPYHSMDSKKTFPLIENKDYEVQSAEYLTSHEKEAQHSTEDISDLSNDRYFYWLWRKNIKDISLIKNWQKDASEDILNGPVKLVAFFDRYWLAGDPKIFNLNILTLDGEKAHFAITQEEYRGRLDTFKSFKGNHVQIEGWLSYNSYHKCNSITSRKGLIPLRLITLKDQPDGFDEFEMPSNKSEESKDEKSRDSLSTDE